MINPVIIRSKRKYLTLIIDSNNNLIVRAPLRTKDKEIFDFINKKQNWINKKLTERKPSIKPLEVVDGETIPILGNMYNIKLQSCSKVHIENDYIKIPQENSKLKLIAYLKAFAKQYLTKRVAELAMNYNFKYQCIRISSAHTNWGSCSFKNSLNFTYKLMLCPPGVVDYIIIHELTHTIIKNHSAKFYSRMEQIIPNFKQYTKWLKENAGIINLI